MPSTFQKALARWSRGSTWNSVRPSTAAASGSSGDRAAAEDATQDVFLKFLREVDWLQDRQTLLPWVYRVASNHCQNLRRDAADHRQHSMGQDLDLLPGTSEDGHDAFPERPLARSVLARFDVATQAIAVAVFVEGMELEEIAAELGLSPRTVSKRLRRFIRAPGSS